MTTRQARAVAERFTDARLEIDHAQDFFARDKLDRCLDSLQRTRAEVGLLEAAVLALSVKRSRK